MAIFGEIGKKITQTTQNAAKGAKDLADIARLNSQITEEQRLMNSFYTQIGKKYYEINHAAPAEEYSQMCVSITECMAKITGLRDEIQKVKGIKKCSGCGAEVPMTTTFCGTCGYDTRKESESEEPSSKCPNCNKELGDNLSFCTDCGQKIQEVSQ